MIWLESTIMLRAFVGCVLAGLLTGLVGVFVVRMKLSSIGYCMSHGAFAGAALGVAAALDPLMTALLFASTTALFIGPVADKARLHADVITSIMFPLNMALAFIFLTFSPEVGLKSDVANVLWGSVLSITNNDAVYLSALCAATVALLYLFWKELFAIMFDRKMAEADGISTKPFVYFIIFLAGLVVTLSLKLVGGLLIFALLFNPASSALQFLDDMRTIVLASPIIGASTCVAGLVLSLTVNLPIGSSIVILSSAVFAVAVIFSPKRRRGEVKSPT
ncbi:MAG: metal ABC transporter permease [Candidatus Bathyarchaeia archaeon]